MHACLITRITTKDCQKHNLTQRLLKPDTKNTSLRMSVQLLFNLGPVPPLLLIREHSVVILEANDSYNTIIVSK
jgi:hypothetical protein